MPMVPREWWVWTCGGCKSEINLSPHPDMPSMMRDYVRCPYCGQPPVSPPPSRRAAIEDPAVGLLGSSETAGLDYLASIANSLVDIRNMLMADHHAVRPMDPGGYNTDSKPPQTPTHDANMKPADDTRVWWICKAPAGPGTVCGLTNAGSTCHGCGAPGGEKPSDDTQITLPGMIPERERGG